MRGAGEISRFQRVKYKALQNQRFYCCLQHMSRLDPATARERLIAHRQRRRAAGRVLVTTYLPGGLVALVDQTKEERGASARASIIEEALRFYFEQKQRALNKSAQPFERLGAFG